MKQIVYALIALCLSNHILHAQDLVQKRFVIFDTKIHDIAGHVKDGFIATMDDSAVYMSQEKFALTFEKLDLTRLQKFGYGDISQINLHARGVVGRDAWVGAISGLVIGGIIGYAATPPKTTKNFTIGPNPTPLEAAAAVGIVGAILGTVTGVILSHPNRVFKIHGKKANLDDMREAMIKRLYL